MKRIYALIKGLDDAMKRIVKELKNEGVYDNTMIIISADNGMFHGSHGLAGKWYPYQESIRVPLIIRDPRMPKDKIGTVDDSLTLNVDLAETILGAAGMEPHTTMQGRDISDLYLSDEKSDDDANKLVNKPWREDFLYEFHLPGDERFLPSSAAVVSKHFKYIQWKDKVIGDVDNKDIVEELYNLTSDPLELNNLLNKENIEDHVSDKLDFMRRRMVHLKEETRSPTASEEVQCSRKFMEQFYSKKEDDDDEVDDDKK